MTVQVGGWGFALLALGVAVSCFLVGAINPAAILARLLGKDVRASGSGNPGATNAGRVLGVRWGVLVLLLDVVKGLLPTLLLLKVAGTWLALWGSLFVILGHMFSPYLRGRGGKGVATALGAIIAVQPWCVLAIIPVFGIAFAVLRYVGLASAVTAVVLGVIGVVEALRAHNAIARWEGWWLALVGVIVLSRHRRNVLAWWGSRRSVA